MCWVQCWPSGRQPLPTIDTKLLAFGWDNFTMSQVIEPIVAIKLKPNDVEKETRTYTVVSYQNESFFIKMRASHPPSREDGSKKGSSHIDDKLPIRCSIKSN